VCLGRNPNVVTGPDPTGGTNYTVTTYMHNHTGNLTESLDALSRDTTLAYDADSRLLSVTLPNPDGGGSGGPSESVVYDAVG
jgi:YD repeat-containing protein